MTLVSQLQTHLLHFLSVEQFNDKSLAKNKDKKLRCWAACVWSYYYSIEPLGALIGNLLPAFSEQLRIRNGIPTLICDSYFLCDNVHYRITPYANTDPRVDVVQDIDRDDARDQEKAEGDDCTGN